MKFFNFKTATLNNGLRLVFVPIPKATSVTSLIMYGVGSKCETNDIRGISHFLEHMLFKGTKKRPTQAKIASEVEKVGAIINGYTDKHLTCFWIKSAPEEMNLSLDVIADMMTGSLMSAKELEKEKGVIIEELNMYEDDPRDKIGDYFENLIFGDNPLGWETIGLKETILATNRQKMMNYWQKFHTAKNAVVAVAGGLKDSDWLKIKKTVGDYFKNLPKSGAKKPIIRSVPLDKKSYFKQKKLEQTHFMLGLPALSSDHPDRYGLSLASLILGGTMSSRLFVKIREERGWAYYVYSAVNFYQEKGAILVAAGVKNGVGREAIRICRNELLDLKRTLTEKEVDEAKTCAVGRFKLALENSQNVAEKFAASWILKGRIETPEELIEKIKKVNLKEMRRVLRENISETKIKTAIIGPKN